jgi:Flp pilus assembly protein TadD
VYAAKGEFGQAIADNNKAIHLDPANADAYNSLGWLLATCPVESIRDGHQAVEAAQKACELSGWKKWTFIDTLAAAFAEAGDFDQATKYQQQAMSMDGLAAKDRAETQRKMDLFQQHKPYHESAAR